MKKLLHGLLSISLLVSQSAFACSIDGTEGFLPENDLNISVDAKRFGGLTEEQFNAVIDKVETVYAPIISGMGAKLNV